MVFTALSFKRAAVESVGYLDRSMSLPLISFNPARPTRFSSALNRSKSVLSYGDFPCQTRSQVSLQICVSGQLARFTIEATPDCRSSFFNIVYFLFSPPVI